jgi:hypothetical protein
MPVWGDGPSQYGTHVPSDVLRGLGVRSARDLRPVCTRLKGTAEPALSRLVFDCPTGAEPLR